MNNVKIAFFDIDGTMIDINNKTLSKKMEETLIQLKENKIIICIATGRPLISVPHFQNVEFDVFLTFNASYCCTRDEVIYKNPIPRSDVQTIIKNAGRLNRPVSVASADRTGVEKILDYYHLTKEQAIAFGDGTNDIEMLQAVGTGVAMGNATDDVKRTADEMCRDVIKECGRTLIK